MNRLSGGSKFWYYTPWFCNLTPCENPFFFFSKNFMHGKFTNRNLHFRMRKDINSVFVSSNSIWVPTRPTIHYIETVKMDGLYRATSYITDEYYSLRKSWRKCHGREGETTIRLSVRENWEGSHVFYTCIFNSFFWHTPIYRNSKCSAWS